MRSAALVVLAGALAVTAGRLVVANPPARQPQPAYQPGFNPTDALLVELISEVKGLRADLRGALDTGKVRTDAVAVIRNRCARCHGEDVSEARGSGITWVQGGEVVALSLFEARAIEKAVRAGTMPPGAPLAANERRAILEYVTKRGGKK